MTNEQTKCVESYRALLSDFIARKINTATFEANYLRKFKTEAIELPPFIFEALDQMFADVDAYNSDPVLRGPDGLDEEELITSAKRTVAALEKI